MTYQILLLLMLQADDGWGYGMMDGCDCIFFIGGGQFE